MKECKQTRRQMLATSGGLLGASLFTIPAFSSSRPENHPPLKVVVSGAHPDDPESGCGGSIGRFVSLGHEVTVLYLTRGEAGIEGVSHDEAAKIRTAEAIEACKVMGARPLFAGQIDGNTIINKKAYSEIAEIIESESPDIVFTHWPIDTHPDHRVNSSLVFNAWNRFRWDESKAFDLYYYEVLTGEQTLNFHPTHFIDITESFSIKKEATLKHVSQKASEWFNIHQKMDEFRGFQMNWPGKYAESFIHQGFTGVI
jgi:LmbE family N-acetylglucosaminyl deacetylase